MSGPASRRSSPALTPPERPPPERGSDPGALRVRYGRLEIAARGLSAVYAAGLAVAFVAGGPTVWRTIEGAQRVATQLDAAAGVLAQAAEDARAARAGVDSLRAGHADIERRIGTIEGDLAQIRADVRAMGMRRTGP